MLAIRERLAPLGGDARVSVLKAVVTQSSAAIPAMPIYLALLFKDFSAPSPLQRILPSALLNNEFVNELTDVRFAEVQNFGGIPIPRPSAPMLYANGWGSTLGLLTPFFILHFLRSPLRLRRRTGIILLVAAVVPVVVSLNRGLWLSLGVIAVYVAVRHAMRRDARMLRNVTIATIVIAVLVLATPLNTLIGEKFEGAEQSNESRTSVYEAAFEYTLESPYFGYGAPLTQEDAPPVGTHGLIWYLMFSHGFPALVTLVSWLLVVTMRSARAPTQTALWAHVCLVIGLVQLPIYGLLPQVVLLGAAAGIAWREANPALATRV